MLHRLSWGSEGNLLFVRLGSGVHAIEQGGAPALCISRRDIQSCLRDAAGPEELKSELGWSLSKPLLLQGCALKPAAAARRCSDAPVGPMIHAVSWPGSSTAETPLLCMQQAAGNQHRLSS